MVSYVILPQISFCVTRLNCVFVKRLLKKRRNLIVTLNERGDMCCVRGRDWIFQLTKMYHSFKKENEKLPLYTVRINRIVIKLYDISWNRDKFF